MKIAVVLPHGSRYSVAARNSIERVVGEFARLSRFRESVRVVCDAGAEDVGDAAVIRIKPTADRALRTRRVVAALRAWRPDLIEIHEQGSPARTIASAFRKCVTCWYRHTVPVPPAGPIRRFRRFLRQLPFDAHVFVSEAALQPFLDTYPRLRTRCHVVRNAVDAQSWHADPRRRAPLIAFIGRPAREKGFAELCGALNAVLTSYPDWRATFVMNEWSTFGGWARGLLAPLESHGDRFRYHTDQGVDVVRRTLQDAAIAVVPSVCAEAFPLAVLEAHAAGAAVVSSGTGGLREASGEHALYLGGVTADAIADAVAQLIRDPAQREVLATNGQRFVAANHGVERRVDQLDDLRERLFAAKTKKPGMSWNNGDFGIGLTGQ